MPLHMQFFLFKMPFPVDLTMGYALIKTQVVPGSWRKAKLPWYGG
jgi:hypothetical protein